MPKSKKWTGQALRREDKQNELGFERVLKLEQGCGVDDARIGSRSKHAPIVLIALSNVPVPPMQIRRDVLLVKDAATGVAVARTIECVAARLYM